MVYDQETCLSRCMKVVRRIVGLEREAVVTRALAFSCRVFLLAFVRGRHSRVKEREGRSW